MIPILDIQDLHATVDGKSVLNGVNLKIYPGEVHAVMGRNGTGKTSLSYTLMGHPKYTVTQGKIIFCGEDITQLLPEDRAKKRLFLSFQYPVAIPGVTVASFLRASLKSVRGHELDPSKFRALIKEELKALDIPESFMTRSLNEGFSGGEKKRLETLQMRLLQPKLSILDEPDSGLDIDALKMVSESLQGFRKDDNALLVITHYQRLLNTIPPDRVHVFGNGKILQTGGPELAHRLERDGYDWVQA